MYAMIADFVLYFVLVFSTFSPNVSDCFSHIREMNFNGTEAICLSKCRWGNPVKYGENGSMPNQTKNITKHSIYKCIEVCFSQEYVLSSHDDVIKWKHFPRYWPFVRGIHRWPVNSPHKGQWHGALMFFFDLRLNKRLSKQWRRRWFETPSRSLCRVWH